MKDTVVTTNRRARHDFTILESFEAGIELKGAEVKSLRAHKANLSDSFARINGRELFLYNMYISPYKYDSYADIELKRKRKLLVHKKEIIRLAGHVSQKGMALVPLRVYFKHGIAKVELAVVRGKKKYDKREAIKQRETKREVERHFHGKTNL